jgi:hypothetical protein
MRALMGACPRAPGVGVSGVERAVVGGRWWPRRAWMPRHATPRAQRGVAEACRSVGLEASVARPRWRTTRVKGVWRVVAGSGVGGSRAGHNQGRGRARGQSTRHRSRGRAAQGPKRSWPPWPGRTRSSRRCGARSAPWSGGPSRRRRPHAESRGSPRRAFARGTKASRARTSCGRRTTGSGWRGRGRLRSKTGHGRCRVRAEQPWSPDRGRRHGRSATVCSWRKERKDGRLASARLCSGARRESGARGLTASREHGCVVGANPRRGRSSRRRRRRAVRASRLFVVPPLGPTRPPASAREMSAQPAGSQQGRRHLGGVSLACDRAAVSFNA